MIYTKITVNTHDRNIIQIIRIHFQSTSGRDAFDYFLKASNGNNLIFKSRSFYHVGAAYTKDQSKK